MKENTLIIPVKTDVLFLDKETTMAEAKANFENLPYNDGKEDVNSEFAFLSENFLSHPFQNNNLLLQPGLHLHWALPDAFTKGKVKDNGDEGKHVEHYPVPDRWIIIKSDSTTKNIIKRWVIESNYLHPEEQDNKYHSIAYPINGKEKLGQPFRYMGRSYEADKPPAINNKTGSAVPEYLDGLTAVGYGEHTFAAFYPNCHSVFGFYDKDVKSAGDLSSLQYEIFGWYNNPVKDPVNELVNDVDMSSSALHFDGKDDFVVIPNCLTNATAFTFEAWVFVNTNNKWQRIFDFGNSASQYLFLSFYDTSLRPRFGFKPRLTDGEYSLDATKEITLNQWHHIAVTLSGDEVIIYINGEQSGKRNDLKYNLSLLGDTNNNWLGRSQFYEINKDMFFSGLLSNVRFWDVARTQEEIKKYMLDEIDLESKAPLAYYKFNDGVAGADNTNKARLTDSSPHQYHGVLNNFFLAGNSSNWMVSAPVKMQQLQNILNQQFSFVLQNTAANFNNAVLPTSSFCFSRVLFNEETTLPVVDNSPAEVVIGNTGTEALSAWLNKQLNGTDNKIEEQIEALQILSKMAGKKLDTGPAFKEAFHEKGFLQVDGGSTWSLKLTDVNTQHVLDGTNKVSAGVEITLPDMIAMQLNELNILQQQYDRASDELVSLQQQLYADWCKYMTAAYHPDIEQSLPPMDEVSFFIKGTSFKQIDKKKNDLSAFKEKINAATISLNALADKFNNSDIKDKVILQKQFNPNMDDSAALTTTKDPSLNNRYVKNYSGAIDTDKEILQIAGQAFNSISFWVNISSSQPAEGNQMVNKDGTVTQTGPGIFIQITSAGNEIDGTSLNTDDAGIYWQNIYINGEMPDPYEVFKWEDIPKDQWVHIYLQGTYSISQPCEINLMQWIKGSMAMIRIFKAGLDSTELFYDMNMIGQKQLKLSAGKGPRYWQPTEPVVLIKGNIAKPSERNGFDKELPCMMMENKQQVSLLLEEKTKLADMEKQLTSQNISHSFLISELTVRQGFFASAQRQVNDAFANLNIAKNENLKLKKQLLEAEAAYNKSRGDVDTNNKLLDSTNKEIADNETKKENVRTQISSLGSSLSDMLKKASLQVPLGIAEAEIVRLNTVLSTLKSASSSLTTRADNAFINLQQAAAALKNSNDNLLQNEALAGAAQINLQQLPPTDGLEKSISDIFAAAEATKREMNSKLASIDEIQKKIDADKFSEFATLLANINTLSNIYPRFKEWFTNTVSVFVIGSNKTVSNPWNPLLLEWKVGITPITDNSVIENYTIPADIITYNYSLADDKPDLILQTKPQYDAQKILSGFSILTPQAKDRILHVIEKYLQTPDASSDELKDFNTVVLQAQDVLNKNNFLSQSLGGFNEALQMLHQTFQLPIADPLGFADDQDFADEVLQRVERQSKYAPVPVFEFDPLRTGKLKLLELNVIDSFGQIKPVYPSQLKNIDTVITNENRYDENIYQPTSEPVFAHTLNNGDLPPRIAQPARVNFRWLSAADDEVEMNEHPAANPVCGWLVPDNIDKNILVFDAEGNAVGSINKAVGDDTTKLLPNQWRSAPGTIHPIVIEQLSNQHLINVINWLLKIPVLDSFIELLDETLDQIDPENFAQHTDLAILMGRPIAIVRASVNLEVKGNYAINQSWESFETDLNNVLTGTGYNNSRQTNGWENVKFPVRIGEHGQLNDGVLGYWIDDNPAILHSSVQVDDTDTKSFFGTATNTAGYDAQRPAITLSPADNAVNITVLMDPRGKAHAACGALPAKIIDIPDDQYKPSLKKMSFTFYTRPLLMPSGKIAIPLPAETGYQWSWLTRSNNLWKEVSTTGIVHKDDFTNAFKNGEAIWKDLADNGWIEETINNKAQVVPNSRRKKPEPTDNIKAQQDKIQWILDSGHIIDADAQAQLSGSNEIKEGWLKLSPIK